MISLGTKQSRCKLLPHSDLWVGSVSSGGAPHSRNYSYKKYQKENHSIKFATWNTRTLNQGEKLENLKKEMQKNAVSVLCVSEVWWKGRGET
jgi:hypothetical protein